MIKGTGNMRVKFLLNFTHIKSIQWFHLASELRRKCIFNLNRTETVFCKQYEIWSGIYRLVIVSIHKQEY